MISKYSYFYCNESINLIENYDLAMTDATQVWECHHRLEIQEDKILSAQDLINKDLYFHRPASELIFLTKSEHQRLHSKNRKEETKKKISKSKKGIPNTWTTSESITAKTRRKISLARTGKHLSEETKEKLSKINKGIKKPQISKALKGKNFSEEHRKNIGNGHKGKHYKKNEKHWFTNGIVSIMIKECPEGFWPGRTYKK